MNIGQNIARLRINKNLKQEELADLLYVSPKTISSWEKNRNLPNIEMLIKLADIFDTDINSIIGLKKDNSKEIQDMYKNKKIKSYIIFLIFSILTFLFFINIQYIGITLLTSTINSKYNIVISSSDITYVLNFMLLENIKFFIFIIIGSIFYLFFKKKWKYLLFITSSIILIISISSIIETIIYNGIYDVIFNFSKVILLVISIIGFKNAITLIKQYKRTK